MLLECLADGSAHSLEDLAAALSTSRSVIAQVAGSLDDLGLKVVRLPGPALRLPGGLDLLEAGTIVSHCRSLHYAGLEVLDTVDSTNAHLLRQLDMEIPSGFACTAEWQSAGRGRRGRSWQAPYGSGVFLSVLLRLPARSHRLSGLTLALGVALARALRAQGVADIAVKWPNDLYRGGAKLGGILVETRVSGGEAIVVVGVGINTALPPGLAEDLDQPVADLADRRQAGLRRSVLAGQLLAAVLDGAAAHGELGWAAFRADWPSLDLALGRQVRVTGSSGEIQGRALGVDATGALLVETESGTRRLNEGDVSLRFRS